MNYTSSKKFTLTTARFSDPARLCSLPLVLSVEVICAGCYVGSAGRLVPPAAFDAFEEYLNARFGKQLEDALPHEEPSLERIAEHLFKWFAGTQDTEVLGVLVTERESGSHTTLTASYGRP